MLMMMFVLMTITMVMTRLLIAMLKVIIIN